GFAGARLIARVAVRDSPRPHTPAFDIVRLYALQLQSVEIESDDIGRFRFIAGHAARNREAGYLVARYIADLPHQMVPLLIAQVDCVVALLPESRRQFLDAVVG